MNKLKNTIILALALFIIQNSNAAQHLHSVKLNDGTSIKIAPGYDNRGPFLLRFLSNGELDTKFPKGYSVFIPLKSNPKYFRIIILNSGNIMVHDKQANEMVIFDKDGAPLKNVAQVKEMIKEKSYDTSGIDKAILLKALFNAARFQGNNILQIGYELTDEDIQTLLNQGDITHAAGRILNINISGDVCDIAAYNIANGENAAQTVINNLRLNHLAGRTNPAGFVCDTEC
ncbi:MAG: hypothetical protein P4L22_07685 [Candidatus Babeliales bacterium]|nr:hypothetical protein [Candidatus Babeliales bacterium]